MHKLACADTRSITVTKFEEKIHAAMKKEFLLSRIRQAGKFL